MNTNGIKILIVLTLSFLLVGCATMSDVLTSKDNGTAKVYPVNANQAWTIATKVLRWEGADAIEEHRDEGYMLANSSMNLITTGTLMGAWVEKVDNSHSKVTVVTKRRIATNLVTTLTETTFHDRFAQAVDIVKKGQPLPATSPPRVQK
ncbi:MAG: hypothetical protein A2Z91_02270 [Deltaproteobacteria bacterium GWA2_38_16]|nr:MAG: hypothetical protein A2Z91_02270 [Deltaproteobacteria bacterium GWA2_38_16]OGQ02021.1 MAG: hypothetical protein A3D19_08565 [Deltaproteobacteria bacterium RIFCSPHIGHO2_02_FULL_38_15]OGQ30887.1 MAG: hypothetical protein A3A72_02060 [Deltaproteobacteria bacterium RIFCSPLOWO2_01_FULL_38_9]OGQ61071.1 MAG: hypothetical protein A3G92_02035 [Deltaproteobacteria bacterium RIFCSPLOWO2_12_FULL_38_8]HBQ21555.1 hypothetical protein [Deltaproteobacteria bacterium]